MEEESLQCELGGGNQTVSCFPLVQCKNWEDEERSFDGKVNESWKK